MNLDFLEIGTSDFDTLLQSESAVSGMSVEPIKLYFDRLPDKANNIKVNCAISDYDGEIDVFYIEPLKIKEFDLPWWVRGCNSVKKYHPTVYSLLKDRKLNPEKIITKHTVPVKRMVTLIKEFDIQSICYLKIDTEGHDCVILNDYIDSYIEDRNVVLPKEILFESNVLSDDLSVEKIKKRLQKIGYREVRSGHDTLMSRELDFFLPLHDVELPITAVILNWKRLDNLIIIIRQFRRREFIKEIIVWNNNPEAIAYHDVGVDEDCSLVRIINSSENLRDYGKYLAASQAKYDHVFYQDDDFSTNHYLDAMHAVFCQNSNKLHIAVGELSWAENHFGTFYNHELGLQAEFCFIGCGAMFPKILAEKHCQYIEKYFSKNESEFADFGFSMLTNQPFVKLQVALTAFNQDYAFSDEEGFDEYSKKLRLKVVDLLMEVTQPKKALKNSLARCLFNECILFTSYIPQELDQYDRVFDPGDSNDIECRTKEPLSKGVSKRFRKNPYFFSIWGEIDKYWHTSPEKGDVWGVWLLTPMNVKLHINALDSHSESSLWVVKIDGVGKKMTLKQMNCVNTHVKHELSVTACGDKFNIGVRIERLDL